MATRRTQSEQIAQNVAARVEREHWLPPGPRQIALGPFRAEERHAGGQWPREMAFRGREFLQLQQSERAARTPPAALRQREILARDVIWREKESNRIQERQHER